MLLFRNAARVTEIVIVLGLPILLLVCVQLLPGDNSGLQQLVISTATLVMVALAYLGLFLRGQHWSHFGLTLGRPSVRGLVMTGLQALLTLAVAAGLFLAAAVGYGWVVTAPESAEATGLEFLQGNLPALLATLGIIYITASLSEEITYRGFLMNRIAEIGGGSRAAWATALLLSSITFGLAHFSWGRAGVVQTAFMGLGLGAAYLAFGRKLWVVILAHGCMDTILLVQVFLSESPGAAA